MTQRNDKVTATVQVGGMINYTPCSVEVGEVTTLPAGSDATVTNSGNEYEAVFDFGIPQGAKGDTGETGATGKSAYESAVEQGYEGTEEEFATSLTTVDTKAAQAAASATAAAGSATSASNSATSASNSATTATTKASEASASATAAAASATSAGSNATAAQNYVTQASTFASNAANSATNAASYASNAAASATNASAMASAASTSASSASASADTASAVLTDPDFVAVAGAVEDITTVATNISDVNATGQAIEDVSAVADNLTDISLVANDLDNIDEVATKVAEWQKPADWVDIRSGALPNSIYYLAAHKKDFSAYNEFGVTAHINTSGDTYDVYIDGIKYQTVSGNYGFFSINWQNANLSSGYDVTYPQALRTHIVRITPTDPTKHFNRVSLGEIGTDVSLKKSVLWVHSNLDYSLNCTNFVGTTSQRMTDSLLEAITARDGVLKCSGVVQMIGGQNKLKTIPILDMQNSTGQISYFAYNSYADNLKKVHIRNLKQTGDVSNSEPFSYTKIKEIIFEDSTVCWWPWFFSAYCLGLEKVPEGLYHPTGEQPLVVNNGWQNLKDTVLDLSQRTGLTYVQIRGNSNSQRLDGLKGLTVSPSAPLNGTSPQIDVKYTGLDRGALVSLFKSMPYNVGYNVTGTPTITNGIMSDFSNSNYAQTNLAFDVSNYDNIEIYVRVKTPATISPGWTDIIENGGVGNSRNLGVYCNNELTSKYFNLFGYDFWRYGISEDTWYRIKVTTTADSQNGYIYDDNGNLLIQAENSQRKIAGNSVLAFGGLYSPNKINAIDFNNTYIKVNGVPWFTGTAAMTKTCSVVGCTGTADLTADDKAIATDKGWALTLS